jgi:hypothetical protein
LVNIKYYFGEDEFSSKTIGLLPNTAPISSVYFASESCTCAVAFLPADHELDANSGGVI